ncbi:MAG: hypothetical protein IJB64_04225 [Akkermansia sp.]|nr:hypothetical protein [Akkermansia sp.]
MIRPPHRSNLHPNAKQPEFGDWRADLPRPEEAEHYPPHALPEHMRRYDDEAPSTGPGLLGKLLRFLAAISILLPVNGIIIYALIHCLGHSSADMENVRFWLRTPIWFSLLGILSFTVIALLGIRRRTCLYIYVLGHELTHAIAILMCLGKIKGMRISTTEGSYVLTNKTNLFIALSPYFIPFWMLVWMALIWSMNRLSPFDTYLEWFYAGFGFWWAFHLFWTAFSIMQERQPDLFDNGLLFSLLIIVLLNFILLIGILMFFGLITPSEYLHSLQECSVQAYHTARALILKWASA